MIRVGGMVFVNTALRPTLATRPAVERLRILRRLLPHFFLSVWVCIAVLLAAGHGIIFWGHGSFAGLGLSVHIMQTLGILLLFFGPWQSFRRDFDRGVITNATEGPAVPATSSTLPLSLLTAGIAISGPYWS